MAGGGMHRSYGPQRGADLGMKIAFGYLLLRCAKMSRLPAS
jgi:hypothetical protein